MERCGMLSWVLTKEGTSAQERSDDGLIFGRQDQPSCHRIGFPAEPLYEIWHDQAAADYTWWVRKQARVG